MRIALISTGDELLSGDIVDTNAAWLATTLSEAGFKLSWHVTVGDDLAALMDAFELASLRAEICLVNGGLGPTSDDLSAQAAASWQGEALKQLPEWVAKLTQHYAQQNRPMPASNLKQALIPQSAQMIDNPVGTACGFKLTHNQCDLYFTPGVPFEFKQMVNQQILPALCAQQAQKQPQLKRWLTLGLSESLIADWLEPITLPAGAILGYRSAMPTIEVKLSVPATCDAEALQHVCQQISQRLAPFSFLTEKKSMAQRIQQLMLASEQTIATAESCTGGLIADWLVAEAGSSAYFERGYVTYSNEAKQHDLGVDAALIEQQGAVSMAVAMAMAAGAKQQAKTHFGLATSGIAGPGGGSDAKPVGTVAFALATPQGIFGQLLELPNRGRSYIRQMAAALALDMLRRYLTAQPVIGQYPQLKCVEQKTPAAFELNL